MLPLRLGSAVHPLALIQSQCFHSSPPSNGGKLDPLKFENSLGKVDTDSVKFFRRIEKNVNAAFDSIPRSHMQLQEKRFWKTKNEDVYDLGSRIEPDNPFRIPPETEKPYDPLELDKDDDYAKALAYISNDDAMSKPGKSDFVLHEDGFPIKEIIHIGRHAQVTTAGRIFSFSALILLGTGKATAGLGYGRGNTVAQAVAMAKKKGERDLMSIELHRGNTIGRDIHAKYKRSFAWMKARRSGHGTQASYETKLILDSFGIEDVTVGKFGSRNRYTTYRALLKGLRDQCRTQEMVSFMLGRKLFNRSKAYYYRHE